MTPQILVPIDFSPQSEQALEWAAQLAGPLAGKLTLLHVVVIPPSAATVATVWVSPTEEDLKSLEQKLVELAKKHDAKASARVAVAADTGVAILKAVQDAGSNLIVMSTHGRGGVKRALLGSVADYVSRHAECPVVTVRGTGK